MNIFSKIKIFLHLFMCIATFSLCEAQDSEKAATSISEAKTEDDKEKVTKDDDGKKKEEPPKIGIFSLPASQQPAALFGLGGNIIDAGQTQIYFFADEFVGKRKKFITLLPSVLFGVTDNFSIYFNFPAIPEHREMNHRSSGPGDFFVQFEYGFYNKSTYTYIDQATLVTSIFTPTGSIKKNPPTGAGAPSLFLGGTYYRTYVNWVFFTAQGAVMAASDHKSKIGDQFLYQFGMVRTVPSPEGWIYAGMLEIDGQYGRKNRIHGHIDKNSGGNAIYVTPSLWVSSKYVSSQFGVSFPIQENFYGNQGKFDYALNFNFSVTFY